MSLENRLELNNKFILKGSLECRKNKILFILERNFNLIMYIK